MLIILSAMAGGVAVMSVLVCPLMTISLQEPVRGNRDRVGQQNVCVKMFVVASVPWRVTLVTSVCGQWYVLASMFVTRCLWASSCGRTFVVESMLYPVCM